MKILLSINPLQEKIVEFFKQIPQPPERQSLYDEIHCSNDRNTRVL